MHLFIYKTNIGQESDVREIANALQCHQHITRWTVDCEDIDKVLRIESTINNPEELILTITKAGYLCEELPD